jgi:opacity protein-like surface antigen
LGDYNVATATKSQNKTSFVKEFLHDNPDGNIKAVNDAWAAAGMTGTIGSTLIYKMRSEMGLSGNLRAKSKPRTAAKAKSTAKMSKTASSPGKTMFVKEFLNDHPQSNVIAVNEAWQAAGFDGTISPTLINKMRASLGLTGNFRGNKKKSKTSATGRKQGRPRKETAATVNGQPRGNRSTVMDDLEADIDRLIFKAMAIGELTEIENSLRQARRLLYGALTRG